MRVCPIIVITAREEPRTRSVVTTLGVRTLSEYRRLRKRVSNEFEIARKKGYKGRAEKTCPNTRLNVFDFMSSVTFSPNRAYSVLLRRTNAFLIFYFNVSYRLDR